MAPPCAPPMTSLSTTLLALWLLLLASLAAAAPSVYFPINAQLPPVARLDEPFSYTPSPHTFLSSKNLQFALADPTPKWLSIDSKTARLWGTPRAYDVATDSDVTGTPIRIVASDEDGSVTLDATLVISKNKAPQVQVPISEQLSGFGDYSAPATLLSYPSARLSYSLDPDTFSHDGPINYYASSADGSPLPPWATFDPQRLVFSGTTPPSQSLTQPPTVYEFMIVASDVVGFSAAHVSFAIAISKHKFSTTHETLTLKGARGQKLRFDGLVDTLRLDGKRLKPSDVTIDASGAPSWLSVDTTSMKGTPPPSATSANFTLKLKSPYDDWLAVTVVVNIAADIFKTALLTLSVTQGERVDVNLSPYFLDPSDVSVAVKTEPASSWLSVKGLKLVGTVPTSSSLSSSSSSFSSSSSLKVSLVATSTKTGKEEVQEFNLQVTNAPVIGKPTSITSQTTPTSTLAPSKELPDHVLSPASVAAIVIAPIAAVAILLGFLVCRHRRQQRHRAWENCVLEISRPITHTLTMNGFSDSSRLPSALDINGSFGFGPSGTRTGFIGPLPSNSPPSLPDYHIGQKGAANNRTSRTVSSFVSDMPTEYLLPDMNALWRGPTGSDLSKNRRSWVTVNELPTPKKADFGIDLQTSLESQTNLQTSNSLKNISRNNIDDVFPYDPPNRRSTRASMSHEQTLLEAFSQTVADLSRQQLGEIRNLDSRSVGKSGLTDAHKRLDTDKRLDGEKRLDSAKRLDGKKSDSTSKLSVVSSASALPAPLDPPRRPPSVLAPLPSDGSLAWRQSGVYDGLSPYPSHSSRNRLSNGQLSQNQNRLSNSHSQNRTSTHNPNRLSNSQNRLSSHKPPTSQNHLPNSQNRLSSHHPILCARNAVFDVSPTTSGALNVYKKRAKQNQSAQARQTWHLSVSNLPPTTTSIYTSTSTTLPLTVQKPARARAPSISVYSDRDMFMYRHRSRLDSLALEADKENLDSGRDSLGVAYGEAYGRLIEDVVGHPGDVRGSVSGNVPGTGPGIGGGGMRPSNTDSTIGRAVSRYSQHPSAWEYTGHDASASTSTKGSGVMAFV